MVCPLFGWFAGVLGNLRVVRRFVGNLDRLWVVLSFTVNDYYFDCTALNKLNVISFEIRFLLLYQLFS